MQAGTRRADTRLFACYSRLLSPPDRSDWQAEQRTHNIGAAMSAIDSSDGDANEHDEEHEQWRQLGDCWRTVECTDAARTAPTGMMSGERNPGAGGRFRSSRSTCRPNGLLVRTRARPISLLVVGGVEWLLRARALEAVTSSLPNGDGREQEA